MHSSNFLSTCIANTVVNYLLFQSPLFEKYYNTMAGLMYVSSEVSWWAGERDRLPGCALWTLTNLEPNTQCTRLPMHSTGNYTLVVWRGALPIKTWTTDRQTDRMKGQIFVSKQAWMTATSVIKWTALCMLHTVEIYIKSVDRQDKALVSSSTDESEQFGNKYSMHKLDMESHLMYF